MEHHNYHPIDNNGQDGLRSTDTNLFIDLLANSAKMVPEEDRQYFNDSNKPDDNDFTNKNNIFIKESPRSSLQSNDNVINKKLSDKYPNLSDKYQKNKNTRSDKFSDKPNLDNWDKQNKQDKQDKQDRRDTHDSQNSHDMRDKHYKHEKSNIRDRLDRQDRLNGHNKHNGLDKDESEQNISKEEMNLKKLEILVKLAELVKSGIKLSQNYNMSSDYNIMLLEYEMHKNVRAKQNSIKWWSNALMGCVHGIEMLSDSYNPFDLKLKGWSEQMGANIGSYNDILGEIYEKYNTPNKRMPPEIKLILMIGGSALQFHLAQNLVSSLPKLGDVFAQNPNLKEMLRQQAVAQKSTPPDIQAKINTALDTKLTEQHNITTQNLSDLQMLREKQMEHMQLLKQQAEIESLKNKLHNFSEQQSKIDSRASYIPRDIQSIELQNALNTTQHVINSNKVPPVLINPNIDNIIDDAVKSHISDDKSSMGSDIESGISSRKRKPKTIKIEM